jgi:hypothetical protein
VLGSGECGTIAAGHSDEVDWFGAVSVTAEGEGKWSGDSQAGEGVSCEPAIMAEPW